MSPELDAHVGLVSRILRGKSSEQTLDTAVSDGIIDTGNRLPNIVEEEEASQGSSDEDEASLLSVGRNESILQKNESNKIMETVSKEVNIGEEEEPGKSFSSDDDAETTKILECSLSPPLTLSAGDLQTITRDEHTLLKEKVVGVANKITPEKANKDGGKTSADDSKADIASNSKVLPKDEVLISTDDLAAAALSLLLQKSAEEVEDGNVQKSTGMKEGRDHAKPIGELIKEEVTATRPPSILPPSPTRLSIVFSDDKARRLEIDPTSPTSISEVPLITNEIHSISTKETLPKTSNNTEASIVDSLPTPEDNNASLQDLMRRRTIMQQRWDAATTSEVDLKANHRVNLMDNKLMQVSITVISLHGIIAKEKGTSSISPSRFKRKGQAKKTSIEETMVVASFSVSKDGVFLTHLPSTPVSLDSSHGTCSSLGSPLSYDSDVSVGGVGGVGGGGEGMFQPVVHWPNTDLEDNIDTPGTALSTLQFKQKFVREGLLTNRYVPQTCPINLSISRNGRMTHLGKANLVIHGDERGEIPLTVPVANDIPQQRRRISVGSPVRQKGPTRNTPNTQMVRTKGDIYQFGLGESPMLTVLVHVRDADIVSPAMEAVHANATNGIPHEESDHVEGKDSSPLGLDNYYGTNHCMTENNEMLTLRQRLAKLEHANDTLQEELDNAVQLCAQQHEENVLLRIKLNLATHNADTLLNELDVAKSESYCTVEI